jgi:transcriptional regulator with XRE-family HTH domain
MRREDVRGRYFTPRELSRILAGIPLKNDHVNRLRLAIALTNCPQYEVAAAVGLGDPALSQIAKGRRDATSDEKARLAGYFGIPVAVLFPLSERSCEVA